MIAALQNLGADGIFHAHAKRHHDFKLGTVLGKDEHIVAWEKPAKPAWMNKVAYDAYPNEMMVREFKVKGRIYVTTILAKKQYHKKDIASLYGLRWQVEINFRSIKSILNMEHLVCKTPDMIKKEIAAHMLGYNIIRIIMAEACSIYQITPNKISFKGTVQLLNQFMPQFLHLKTSARANAYRILLSMIVSNKVGNRPGRVEPRVIKRRQKPFPKLKNKRKFEKEKIIRNRQKKIFA